MEIYISDIKLKKNRHNHNPFDAAGNTILKLADFLNAYADNKLVHLLIKKRWPEY
jgi:hypothetical protein